MWCGHRWVCGENGCGMRTRHGGLDVSDVGWRRALTAAPGLVAGFVLCALWLVGAPAAGARPRALRAVTVSAPVPALASCHLNGDDNTPRIVVDPRNSRHIVMSYLTGDDRAAVVASSVDGGSRWSRRVLPGLTSCTGGPPGQLVDPSLNFAPGGGLLASNGWVASIPPSGARDHQAIREYINAAPRVGSAWSAPHDLERTQPDQRGFFAMSGARTLVETERAHYLAPVGYTSATSTIAVLSSANAGRSWSKPVIAATSKRGHFVVAQGLLSNRGGVVAALYGDVSLSSPANAPTPVVMRVAISTNGGRSFKRDVRLGDCKNANDNRSVGCYLPHLVVAPDGSLLVAFVTATPNGRSDLRLARSTNGGRSWHLATIAHVAGGIPLVALAARQHQIGVLAMQDTTGPGKALRAVLWTAAAGRTRWSSQVLGGPYQQSTITHPHFDGQLGPEQGLVALPDGFGAAFTVLAPAHLRDGEQDVVYVHVIEQPG